MTNRPKIVDQTEVSGAHNLLITSVLARGELVKEASDKSASVADAASCVFADPLARLWPLDSADNTVKSAVSLELQKDGMFAARYLSCRRAIEKAADFHGCLDTIGDARRLVDAEKSATVKEAATVKYAVAAVNEIPLTGSDAADTVKTAAASLLERRGDFPLPLRREGAREILKFAATHNVVVPVKTAWALESMAGYGVGLPVVVARQLAARAEKVARLHPEVAVELLKSAIQLGQITDASYEFLHPMMTKAAEVMDEVDNRMGVITGQDGILSPEDAAFQFPTAQISQAAGSAVDVGGQIYNKDDVSNIPPAAFAPVDPGMPGSVASDDDEEKTDPEKLAKVASGRGDVMERVMRGFGVRPMTVGEPEDSSRRIVAGELERWANIARGMGCDISKDPLSGEFDFTPGGLSQLPLGREEKLAASNHGNFLPGLANDDPVARAWRSKTQAFANKLVKNEVPPAPEGTPGDPITGDEGSTAVEVDEDEDDKGDAPAVPPTLEKAADEAEGEPTVAEDEEDEGKNSEPGGESEGAPNSVVGLLGDETPLE